MHITLAQYKMLGAGERGEHDSPLCVFQTIIDVLERPCTRTVDMAVVALWELRGEKLPLLLPQPYIVPQETPTHHHLRRLGYLAERLCLDELAGATAHVIPCLRGELFLPLAVDQPPCSREMDGVNLRWRILDQKVFSFSPLAGIGGCAKEKTRT